MATVEATVDIGLEWKAGEKRDVSDERAALLVNSGWAVVVKKKPTKKKEG